jgi:hypothetical protein
VIDFFGQAVVVGLWVAVSYRDEMVLGVVEAIGPGGCSVKLYPSGVSVLRESGQVIASPPGNDVD